jgi:hypothetical protein
MSSIICVSLFYLSLMHCKNNKLNDLYNSSEHIIVYDDLCILKGDCGNLYSVYIELYNSTSLSCLIILVSQTQISTYVDANLGS